MARGSEPHAVALSTAAGAAEGGRRTTKRESAPVGSVPVRETRMEMREGGSDGSPRSVIGSATRFGACEQDGEGGSGGWEGVGSWGEG